MRATALRDLIAGLSVAMVILPQSLAYAELAGMPPVVGLYTSAVPLIAAAVFASSPYLATGPVAITALLTFGSLSAIAKPGSPEYVQLGLGLALVVGVARILLGLLRAGWLAYMMSAPMLLGFVPGAAILIASSQMPKALGVSPPESGNDIARAAWSLAHPSEWGLAAIAVSVLTVALILGGRRLHRLFPGVLVASVLAIAVSAAGLYSGPVVDSLPAGLPPLTIDNIPWDRLPDLVVPGIVIALVGFSEAASISRRFASEDRVRWNANRELISQGVANVAAAASGGMPCGGSFSRSALNRISGAATRLSGGITGLGVLMVLPFASIFEPLPLAVLGAIVIAAVVGLIRIKPLLRLWRVSVPQAMVAWATFVATLVLAPRLDIAVFIGVGLSIAVFVWRSLQLEMDVDYDDHTLSFIPRGVLWYGTAQRMDSTLLDALAAHPDAQRLVIDLARLGRIDTTGALMLRSVLDHARDAKLAAELQGVPPQSQALVDRVLKPDADPLGS